MTVFASFITKKFISEGVIRDWAGAIGLLRSNCIPVPVSAPTKGQAETVKIGAEAASFLTDTNEETIVFNIGTIYNNLKNPRVKALTISMSIG